MRNAWRVLTLMLVSAAAVASEVPASTPMTGFARYESNKWLFRSCHGNGSTAKLLKDAAPFIDATRDRILFAAIQQRWQQSADPLRGVYLEFAGYAENGRVTATELHRALGWVASCGERPNNVPVGVLAWAAGNEPSWGFSADAKAVAFRTLGGVLTFPATALKPGSPTSVYEAHDSGGHLRIEFTDGLCSDTMTEAAFGRRVVAAVNGALYTGCGLVR
jgi:uncharacterized membrane protein